MVVEDSRVSVKVGACPEECAGFGVKAIVFYNHMGIVDFVCDWPSGGVGEVGLPNNVAVLVQRIGGGGAGRRIFCR